MIPCEISHRNENSIFDSSYGQGCGVSHMFHAGDDSEDISGVSRRGIGRRDETSESSFGRRFAMRKTIRLTSMKLTKNYPGKVQARKDGWMGGRMDGKCPFKCCSTVIAPNSNRDCRHGFFDRITHTMITMRPKMHEGKKGRWNEGSEMKEDSLPVVC